MAMPNKYGLVHKATLEYGHDKAQVTFFDDLTTSAIKMADMKDDLYQHSANQFY